MVGNGSCILVLNAGSSSVKFRLYQGMTIFLDGVVDGIGGQATIELIEGKKTRITHKRVPDYLKAAQIILDLIKELDLLKPPHAIIHRVTHGRNHSAPKVLTHELVHELKQLIPLSPLHLPPSIALVEFFMHHTDAKQIACFDTMFHRSMPEVARMYAIPQSIAKEHGIYRYGFHGLAHEAMFLDVQKRAKKKFSRVITCQLGNGASLCAIKNGKSIDTTMGLTPLEGLVMGTRSGDIDPAVIIYLAHHGNMHPEMVLDLLEKRSGLKGIAGEHDVRKLLAREKQGDESAALALDLFAYRVRKYLGAYLLLLGGADCIVLSGGVARAPRMRERILRDLSIFGIAINAKANTKQAPVRISKGKVQIWVLEVDEQEHMRKLAESVL